VGVLEVEPAGSGPIVGDKGLKKDALGFVSSWVIGVASTAPGYSLAASLRRPRSPRLGSTPHRLIHVTRVPVLVVRGEEAPGR